MNRLRLVGTVNRAASVRNAAAAACASTASSAASARSAAAAAFASTASSAFTARSAGPDSASTQAAQQVQGVRRQRHLPARQAAQPVQGVRRQQICASTASSATCARSRSTIDAQPKECGGKGGHICHGRQRNKCKECGGSACASTASSATRARNAAVGASATTASSVFTAKSAAATPSASTAGNATCARSESALKGRRSPAARYAVPASSAGSTDSTTFFAWSRHRATALGSPGSLVVQPSRCGSADEQIPFFAQLRSLPTRYELVLPFFALLHGFPATYVFVGEGERPWCLKQLRQPLLRGSKASVDNGGDDGECRPAASRVSAALWANRAVSPTAMSPTAAGATRPAARHRCTLTAWASTSTHLTSWSSLQAGGADRATPLSADARPPSAEAHAQWQVQLAWWS